jgi:hypothetical protein
MPGSIGRAGYVCIVGGLTALLWWQRLWHGRSLMTSISNKAVLPRSWKRCASVLRRSAGRPQVKLPVKPSWWWLGGVGGSGEAFFNKWLFALLWYCWFLLLLSSLLPGRGGVEWGETPATSCTIRGGSGDPVRLELIHDRGKLASTFLCRQGSAISTSSEEAWIRFRCGCSKSLSHEVMHSPWLRDGP